jgi:hypothetical protein
LAAHVIAAGYQEDRGNTQDDRRQTKRQPPHLKHLQPKRPIITSYLTLR